MIKMQDIGELGYGGLVTLSTWWDDKRIEEGKLTKKDVLKKASFYAYLIPGGLCTLTSAFGWVKALKPWDEHISHGFIYGFPGFIKDMVDAMREETQGGGSAARAAAVREANKILAEQQRVRALTHGRDLGRSYQPEFAHKTFAW